MSWSRSVVVSCLIVMACFLVGRVWASCTWQDCKSTKCIYFGTDPILGAASCQTFGDPEAVCMYSVGADGGPLQDTGFFTTGQLWTGCDAGSCTTVPSDGSKNQNSIPNGAPVNPNLYICLGGSGCGYTQ
jgi:hypothetical protein